MLDNGFVTVKEISKCQAPISQKVVNRKLGRTTVFTIYDRFTKLIDF
jgi:hypothetical protein